MYAGRARRVMLLGALSESSGGGYGSASTASGTTNAADVSAKLEEWILDDAGGLNATSEGSGEVNRGQTVVWEDGGGNCEPMADWQTTFHVSIPSHEMSSHTVLHGSRTL